MSKGLGKLQLCILNSLLGKDGNTFEMAHEEFYLNVQCAYYDISIWKDIKNGGYYASKDGIPFKDPNIEDELNRRRASISQSLRSLRQKGLTQRGHGGLISLTQKGKEVLNIKSLNT